MKLLHITALIVLLAFTTGCKNKPETTEIEMAAEEIDTSDLQPKSPQEIMAPTLTKLEESQEFEPWEGKYYGLLPCRKGCSGFAHDIELRKDTTYTMKVQEIGLDPEPRVYNGKFSWDKEKRVVTLDAEGDHLKFLVQKGNLKKLDKFGNDEQGAPQEKYILAKKK